MPIAGKNHHGGTSPHPTITAAEITTRNGLIKKWAGYAPDAVPNDITDGLEQIDTKLIMARSANPAALAEKLTVLVELLGQVEEPYALALARSCQRDAAHLAGGAA